MPPLLKVLFVCLLFGAMQLLLLQLSSQNSEFLGFVKREARKV